MRISVLTLLAASVWTARFLQHGGLGLAAFGLASFVVTLIRKCGRRKLVEGIA